MSEKTRVKANIFYAEDVLFIRKRVKHVLERNGYRVALEAASVADSLVLIPVAFLQHDINGAILDSNLSDGRKGSEIAEAIRENKLPVTIFVYAGQEETFGDTGLNLEKKQGDMALLGALDSVYEPKAVGPVQEVSSTK